MLNRFLCCQYTEMENVTVCYCWPDICCWFLKTNNHKSEVNVPDCQFANISFEIFILFNKIHSGYVMEIVMVCVTVYINVSGEIAIHPNSEHLMSIIYSEWMCFCKHPIEAIGLAARTKFFAPFGISFRTNFWNNLWLWLKSIIIVLWQTLLFVVFFYFLRPSLYSKLIRKNVCEKKMLLWISESCLWPFLAT